MTERVLAILGGEPAFRETLHVGRPNIGDRERLLQRLGGALDRAWLTNNGPLVREFENEMRRRLGVKHCIAMCNATVGLEIAIRAAGLEGEVIVPSFTFVATAHALQWQKITPVFCEIDPATHNIDPARVERLVTADTSGIIGVHLWGRPCAIDDLQAIADRHGLALMFDAAHAMGSTYRGRPIGNFGIAEVFSFHATKVMNSFEGGMVATNDDELNRRIRLMHNFGFTGLDSVEFVGINGKMSEPAAAMALTSLESLDGFIATNVRNHRAYREHLGYLPGIELVQYPKAGGNNHQYVIVEVHEDGAGLSRDLLMHVLHAENVRARRYFYPGCHRMEPYRSLNREYRLPHTEALCERVLCLPTGSSVDEDDIAVIGQILRQAIRSAAAVRKRAQSHLPGLIRYP